jgi:hypothetical protein
MNKLKLRTLFTWIVPGAPAITAWCALAIEESCRREAFIFGIYEAVWKRCGRGILPVYLTVALHVP